MKGEGQSSSSKCDPFKTNKEMGVSISETGEILDSDEQAIPCGVAAKYYFNDIYELYDSNGNAIPI